MAGRRRRACLRISEDNMCGDALGPRDVIRIETPRDWVIAEPLPCQGSKGQGSK
jgi:hypothetical protein